MMLKGKMRKIGIASLLSLCLTFMQTAGWQISMKYGTSVHQSPLFQRIGVLETWQCVLVGIAEFCLFGAVIFLVFSRLEKRGAAGRGIPREMPGYFWAGAGVLLFLIYLFLLVGCYPGFYNYDVGNQIPQVLYPEVPYNAHHPLFHTLLMGGIIKLGYRVYGADLTFGVFLYCGFQMAVCAACFAFSLRFIYRQTRNRALTTFAFCFYAFCPSVVLFAMSTTKDILCHALLLTAVLDLYDVYGRLGRSEIPKIQWIRMGGALVLSCLFRNNVIWGIIAFAVCAILMIKQKRELQIFFYICVTVCYLLINKGLILALDAVPGSVTEALSVPFQQIARLYMEEGEGAFTEEEQELLYSGIDQSMLCAYNPFIADGIKYAFWCNLDTLKQRKWDFLELWVRKGLQYPRIYMDAFLDNTYQAWYPGTVLADDLRGNRYFEITDWQAEYGKPQLPWLYGYYEDLTRSLSYRNYPVLRLLFSIGAMFWTAVVTWFYGLWRRDRRILTSLGLVLWVCATALCGPVSNVRYYLILFYMMPVCAACFFRIGENR